MRSLQAGTWQMGVGHTLRGKTLGIHGYGRIGSAVAGYGKAFGMRRAGLGARASLRARQADGHAVAPSQAASSSNATSSRCTCAWSTTPAASSPPRTSRA